MLEDKLASIKIWFTKLRLWQKVVVSSGGLALAAFSIFFLLILGGVFGHIPNKKDLSNLEQLQASRVYSSDGQMLGKLFEINRIYISLDTLPKHLSQTLIAVEDERFYQHSGIDYKALFRSAYVTLFVNDAQQGGSTISQQLIKNTIGRKSREKKSGLIIEKIKEIIAASRLETLYSKDEILELYLNTVPFGENVYGIEAAAERFFNKHPSDLKIEEGSVLIGLLKANTSLNPRLHPTASKERRNVVLGQLLRNEIIGKKTCDSLKDLPLIIDYNVESLNQVQAHYMREVERKSQELLSGQKKRNGEGYEVKEDGLKIFTTIDSRVQQAVEEAVADHMPIIQKQLYKDWGKRRPWGRNSDILKRAIQQSRRYKWLANKGYSKNEITAAFKKPVQMEVLSTRGAQQLQWAPLDSVKHAIMQLKAASIAIDNEDGSVLAYVGSQSAKFYQYDYVKAKRQVASTFKPIVFATALDQGYKPCNYYRNEKITYKDYDDWSPSNFDDNYGGKYSMQGALANSVNVVAVDLLYKARRDNVIELARKMGIESEIPAFPSIALGVADISPEEMVSAFSVFPSGGKAHDIHIIQKIEDRGGRIIYERKYQKGRRVLDDDDAQIMVELLQGVVDKGTGRRLRLKYKLENDLAGKTGTSQGYSDGWFVGFNPKITMATWVGADSREVHFRNGTYGQGSNMALPIFGLAFQKMNSDTSLSSLMNSEFEEPSEKVRNMLDCADYVDKSGLEKFFDIFRSNEMSDEKIHRKNKRKKVLRSIFDVFD